MAAAAAAAGGEIGAVCFTIGCCTSRQGCCAETGAGAGACAVDDADSDGDGDADDDMAEEKVEGALFEAAAP